MYRFLQVFFISIITFNAYTIESDDLANLVGRDYITSLLTNIDYLEDVIKTSDQLKSPRDKICLTVGEIIGEAKTLSKVFPDFNISHDTQAFPFVMKTHIILVLNHSKRIAVSCETDFENITNELFSQIKFYVPKLREILNRMVRALNGERCTDPFFACN